MVQYILTGSSAGTNIEFRTKLSDLGIAYRFILFFLHRCVLFRRTNLYNLFAVKGYFVTMLLRFVLYTAGLWWLFLMVSIFYVIILLLVYYNLRRYKRRETRAKESVKMKIIESYIFWCCCCCPCFSYYFRFRLFFLLCCCDSLLVSSNSWERFAVETFLFARWIFLRFDGSTCFVL